MIVKNILSNLGSGVENIIQEQEQEQEQEMTNNLSVI